MKTSAKGLLIVATLLAAFWGGATAPADEICLDIGAAGPIPVSLPRVCIPVP